jgi:urease accessory protein
MVAPASNVGFRAGCGCASLEVELVCGKSTVTSSYASSPLKLLTPQARGQSVWAFTSSFGGGLVAGDETSLNLRLGANTRCFIGTQASTKIYRNPSLRPCGHITDATLAADSLLVFAPDPVQAFAQSSYTQRQEFRLAESANIVLLDWFSSGRLARGERWEFKDFRTRNEVWVADRMVFLDSLVLDPEDGPFVSQHRTGRFNCFAVLLVLGPMLRGLAKSLLADISERHVNRQSPLLMSASPVGEGALLRVAGTDVESVGRQLKRLLGALAEPLGDDPWARKW